MPASPPAPGQRPGGRCRQTAHTAPSAGRGHSLVAPTRSLEGIATQRTTQTWHQLHNLTDVLQSIPNVELVLILCIQHN